MNLRKLFLILLLIGIIVISIISYFNLSILIKPIESEVIVRKFQTFNKILSYSKVIFFFTLLILSNIIYLKNGKGSYFIISAIFFIGFTLLDYITIRGLYFSFLSERNFMFRSLSFSTIVGILVSILGAAISIAYYVLLRQHLKRKEIRKQQMEQNNTE